MLKKILLIFVFVIEVFAVDYDMKISAEKLQSEANKQFPYVYKNFIMDTTIKNAKIDFKKNSDRLFIQANIKIVLNDSYMSEGFAHFNAGIFYNKEQRALFLQDLKVDKIDMNNIEAAYKDSVEEIIQSIARAILEKTPVYQIEQKDEATNELIKHLQNVSVKDEKLVLTFAI